MTIIIPGMNLDHERVDIKPRGVSTQRMKYPFNSLFLQIPCQPHSTHEATYNMTQQYNVTLNTAHDSATRCMKMQHDTHNSMQEYRVVALSCVTSVHLCPS